MRLILHLRYYTEAQLLTPSALVLHASSLLYLNRGERRLRSQSPISWVIHSHSQESTY